MKVNLLINYIIKLIVKNFIIYNHRIKMSKQSVGLKRNTIDKYYTNNNTVNYCFDLIKKNIDIDYDNDLIIEPSAGNGAFISQIKTSSKNNLFIDLEPENSEIIKQDYLDLDISFKCNYRKIHVIGNPPFGRQSSIAINFIKKSAEFCDSISFILPKSFKKESLKNHFPLSFHLIIETELPDNSFLVEGKEYNVPCVFQIWKKKSEERMKKEKLNPVNFKFVNKSEPHDISFRRVGVYAGKIDTETIDKSVQSHYFIKFTRKINKEILNALINIKFDTDNTVGPKSISKQELMEKFNSILQN
jgi:predicted RNA methylase